MVHKYYPTSIYEQFPYNRYIMQRTGNTPLICISVFLSNQFKAIGALKKDYWSTASGKNLAAYLQKRFSKYFLYLENNYPVRLNDINSAERIHDPAEIQKWLKEMQSNYYGGRQSLDKDEALVAFYQKYESAHEKHDQKKYQNNEKNNGNADKRQHHLFQSNTATNHNAYGDQERFIRLPDYKPSKKWVRLPDFKPSP